MNKHTKALTKLIVVIGTGLLLSLFSGDAAARVKIIEECRTIKKPGLYILKRNLSAEAPTKVCLVIDADFVTIDLRGFAIRRTVKRHLPGTGISTIVGRAGITIRNGNIVGLRNGIILTGSFYSRVENMSVIEHGGGGAAVTTTAIDAGLAAHVSDNIVGSPRGTATVATGIDVTCPSLVVSNVVNIGPPQTAYFDSSASSFADCTFKNNLDVLGPVPDNP